MKKALNEIKHEVELRTVELDTEEYIEFMEELATGLIIRLHLLTIPLQWVFTHKNKL